MEQAMCSKCSRVSPIRDFMNPTSTAVFKSCIICRQASRARGLKRREKKRSRLEAFNALQQQTPQLAEYLYNAAPFFTYPRVPSPLRQELDSSRLGSESADTTSSQTMGTTATAYSYSQETSRPSHSSDGDGEGENSPPPFYFVCVGCQVTRSANLEYEGICVYCLEIKQQYCIKGSHEADATEFQDEEGRRYFSCKECREGKVEVKGEVEDSGDDSESSESSEE